jgi:alpha-L-arabinofuranosidase
MGATITLYADSVKHKISDNLYSALMVEDAKKVYRGSDYPPSDTLDTNTLNWLKSLHLGIMRYPEPCRSMGVMGNWKNLVDTVDTNNPEHPETNRGTSAPDKALINTDEVAYIASKVGANLLFIANCAKYTIDKTNTTIPFATRFYNGSPMMAA